MTVVTRARTIRTTAGPIVVLAAVVPASLPAQPAPGGSAQAAVAVAAPGQAVASKAVELRVTGVRALPPIGPRAAAAGRELVIVETAWKNLVSKKAVNRTKAADRTAGAGSLGFGGGASAQDKAEDAANTTLEDVRFDARPLTSLHGPDGAGVPDLPDDLPARVEPDHRRWEHGAGKVAPRRGGIPAPRPRAAGAEASRVPV